MRIDQVTVKNFRNLAEIEVPFQPGTVLVGENRVGKSNFIHALRLVLDPTLPNSERYLRREDFWDGLSDGTPGWDPMVAAEEIEVSIDFSDFENEPAALTALSEALIEGDPINILFRCLLEAATAANDELHDTKRVELKRLAEGIAQAMRVGAAMTPARARAQGEGVDGMVSGVCAEMGVGREEGRRLAKQTLAAFRKAPWAIPE